MSLMTGLVRVWVAVSKMLQNMQQYLEREDNRPSIQKEVDKMEVGGDGGKSGRGPEDVDLHVQVSV